MTIQVVPTPGTCGSWDAPVNVAVRDLYSEIRRANSGAKNYDAANLGMYLQVYDSACTYYAWMVRLYGLLRTTIVGNRYTPEDLFTCMSVDYNNLVQNMANFRAYINTYAAKLFALKVPSKWHVIERHMWMFSNVFLDAPSSKAQFYLFTPKAFWQYTLADTAEETGLFLEVPDNYYATEDARCTVNDITEFGNRLLNSVLNDEDFNIMSGDIIKTYGDKVFRLNMIDDLYSVVPTYEPEALLQIHNMSVIQIPSSADATNPLASTVPNWSIQEDYSDSNNVGALKFTATIPVVRNNLATITANVSVLNATLLLKNIIDVPVDNATPELTVLATRLQIACGSLNGTSTDNYVVPYAYGTEIVTNVFIYYRNDSDKGYIVSWYGDSNASNADETFAERPIVKLATFTSLTPNGTNAVSLPSYIIKGEINNYTTVDRETLFNIHRAVLLNMYEMTK